MNDLISRQAAIDAIGNVPDHDDGMVWEALSHAQRDVALLPSAQPERLTDDDFETIRIHLSAFKEDLCNQHRWKEAEDYERLISRFISFASTQPKVEKKGKLLDANPVGECSVCGWLIDYRDGFNYCPHCGARMEPYEGEREKE